MAPNLELMGLWGLILELQLERWSEAVRDYEVLRRELPEDSEVAEGLFYAQVALKKSRGEEVQNMKFGGEVEEISDTDQFKAAISSPGMYSHFSYALHNSFLHFRIRIYFLWETSG